MNKDIIISINGLHKADNDNENIEVIAPGKYYNKEGKHYIVYNEVSEDTSDVSKNTIKIADKKVDIIRKGASNVHMVFEEGKKNISYYNTPFGELLLGLSTNKVDIESLENEMNISIDYSLEVNYEHVSDCIMKVNVRSKEGANINLG